MRSSVCVMRMILRERRLIPIAVSLMHGEDLVVGWSWSRFICLSGLSVAFQQKAKTIKKMPRGARML